MRQVAEIQAFGGGIVRAKETLHAFAEILRADEEWLGAFGVFRMELDEDDGGARRESGEEVFVVRCVKVLAAVEIQHGRRILRWVGECFVTRDPCSVEEEEVERRQLKVEREDMPRGNA